MARFMGMTQGGRGEATRLGTPKSGITALANGWKSGVLVRGRPNKHDDSLDEFAIALTGGSNGDSQFLLGHFRETPSGRRIFVPSQSLVEAIEDSEGESFEV